MAEIPRVSVPCTHLDFHKIVCSCEYLIRHQWFDLVGNISQGIIVAVDRGHAHFMVNDIGDTRAMTIGTTPIMPMMSGRFLAIL